MKPHDLEAEQAVLGALLFENSILWRLGAVTGDDFYDPVHGRLFDEISRRIRAGMLADASTLREWANADAGAKEIGGVQYLLKLLDAAAPLTAQAQAYADMIVDLRRRRDVARLCAAASAVAAQGEKPAHAIIAELESGLQGVSLDANDQDAFVTICEAAAHAVERAELDEAKGLSTGFEALDAMIGGLRPKLYLIGAASSMGKTTLVSAIQRNVARTHGVVSFMLEMDEIEDGLRTASALAFVNDHRVESPHYLTAQRNALTERQRDMMRGAAKATTGLHILTDYRQGRTLRQIEASARRGLLQLRRKGVTPGLVVIDHEGLIAPEPGQRFPNQLEATNARAVALMGLPERLGVPVLVSGQLTKDGKRADGEERLPSTDDWKYGGALIEAAHAVILLHRKAYYAERKPIHLRSRDDEDVIRSREATLIVDKARGGRRGQTTIFMDMPSAAVWGAA